MSKVEELTDETDRLNIITNEIKFSGYASRANDPLLKLYTDARMEMFAKNPKLLKYSSRERLHAIKRGRNLIKEVRPTENISFSNLFKELLGIDKRPEIFATRLLLLAYLSCNLGLPVWEFISFCLVTADQIMEKKVCHFSQEKRNAFYEYGIRESAFILNNLKGLRESAMVTAHIPRLNSYLEKIFQKEAPLRF